MKHEKPFALFWWNYKTTEARRFPFVPQYSATTKKAAEAAAMDIKTGRAAGPPSDLGPDWWVEARQEVPLVTARGIVWRGHAIPEGRRVVPITGGGTAGKFWIDDLQDIPRGSLDRHDATYRGIVVEMADVKVAQ